MIRLSEVKQNFWKYKNVFVTGGSGFLGSYIVEQLIELQANVVCLIRDINSRSRIYYEKLNEKITIVFGDLTNYSLIERILNEYEIEVVFHLGAQTLVQIANYSPLSTFESNIKGSWNIFEACRHSKYVNEVVVASSDKAYGQKDKLPYTEEDSLDAIHPYDLSKAITDKLAHSYFYNYDLNVVITRCGNLYGGGDLNFNRIVPQTIRSILSSENPVLRSDGSPVRDYFFVEDAASSYILLAENLTPQKLAGQAFNFGGKIHLPVIDLVNKMIEISGNSELKVVIDDSAKGEIQAQYLSTDKAEKMLNWKPKFSLDEGLIKSFNWYRAWFNNEF